MLRRCCDPSHDKYPYYGGRGIRVTDAWRDDFARFLADVGPRPGPQYTLDRIDSDGHYEPGNVRWATRTEQMNNKRTNVLLTHEGRTQTLQQWAREIGVHHQTLADRLKRGWSVADAVTRPRPINSRNHRRT